MFSKCWIKKAPLEIISNKFYIFDSIFQSDKKIINNVQIYKISLRKTLYIFHSCKCRKSGYHNELSICLRTRPNKILKKADSTVAEVD